jgi:hypothetical protein
MMPSMLAPARENLSLVDAGSHPIAYVGLPSGLTALEILDEVVGSRK